jgi:hypothetical protein
MPRNELPVERALNAMENARYDEAISLFQAQLIKRQDDLKSLLQLGFCHLLNRSEKMFLSVYKQARALKHRLGEIADDVRRLFLSYENWVKKLTATTIILASVHLSSCDEPGPSPLYAAPPDLEFETEALDAGDTAGETETVSPF